MPICQTQAPTPFLHSWTTYNSSLISQKQDRPSGELVNSMLLSLEIFVQHEEKNSAKPTLLPSEYCIL